MKGQSALEAIILLGFILMMTIPILFIFINVDRYTPAMSQARASVQIIADNANKVYAQGPNAQIITIISVPQYCKNISTVQTLDGGEIIFDMVSRDGKVQVYQKTFAPLNDSTALAEYRTAQGQEYLTPGLQKVKIYMDTDEHSGKQIVRIEPYD